MLALHDDPKYKPHNLRFDFGSPLCFLRISRDSAGLLVTVVMC